MTNSVIRVGLGIILYGFAMYIEWGIMHPSQNVEASIAQNVPQKTLENSVHAQ